MNFIASSTNYRTIIAEKDYLSYIPFFIKNYSSYISSNIPADQLPNPQELLAKVHKEEQTVPKGKFVVVQTEQVKDTAKQVKTAAIPAYSGPYSPKQSNSWC